MPRAPRQARKRRQQNRSRSRGLANRLREVENRARFVTNRRLGLRSDRMSVQSAIAETVPPPIESLPFSKRLVRWFFALLMLPFCIITTVTLFQQVSDQEFFQRFWRSTPFWYFTTGFFIIASWFFTKVAQKYFLYLYVLGHELTHAFFVYVSFGYVSELKVTLQGGYVVTNKTNILIALSPYFVPFWTCIVVILGWLLSLITPIPFQEKILFFFIGATWGFHILWTLWMIPKDQPDLQENDTIFSIALIYLANILIVTALVCVASPLVSWEQFFSGWHVNFEKMLDLAKLFAARQVEQL